MHNIFGLMRKWFIAINYILVMLIMIISVNINIKFGFIIYNRPSSLETDINRFKNN